MEDKIKISQLPDLVEELADAAFVPVVQGGSTWKFAPRTKFVKNTGDETIAGVKTFSSKPVVTGDALISASDTSSTPSMGKAMVWKTGVINASLSTSYFSEVTGSFTLTQINEVLYIHSDISFAARTITAGDTVFTFTGLSVSSSKMVNSLVGVDTTTVRTLAGWAISIVSNGSGTINIYPKSDRALIGGQILNATGLYGDASVYIG